MNKAIITKLEKEFDIWNIHEIQYYTGNYKLGFKFMIEMPDEDYSMTWKCLVRSKETIKQALERTLYQVCEYKEE